MAWIDKYIPAADIPEGQSNEWRVERFAVSEQDAAFHNMRCAFAFGSRGREIAPGTYTRLCRGGQIVMSDTPAEKRDHYGAVLSAKGRVLVSGLGLGVVAQAMLLKPEVQQVTVVEISGDVMALVLPTLQERFGARLRVVQADTRTWKPGLPKGTKYDYCWHDIWDTICGDNYEDMKLLRRRFGRWAAKQGCWAGDATKDAAHGR